MVTLSHVTNTIAAFLHKAYNPPDIFDPTKLLQKARNRDAISERKMELFDGLRDNTLAGRELATFCLYAGPCACSSSKVGTVRRFQPLKHCCKAKGHINASEAQSPPINTPGMSSLILF